MSWKTSLWRGAVAIAGAAALTAAGATASYAQPPHPPGEEEGGTNNLSVPAIFVPSTTDSPFAGACPSDASGPTGVMGVDTDGDGIPDEHTDYWVQGVASWQAECDTAGADEVTVAAEWGDNLTNAPLKARTPIRVEIGFLADPTLYPMAGFTVVKLDPALLDRESHYGTLGSVVDPFGEVRVWNSGVTLDIRNTDGTVVVANSIPFVAEINSTGRVVYGFNWQNPVAGEYVITVTAPTIVIGSADAGKVVGSHTVTLAVTVGNKGGGGPGRGGRPGDRPRGGGGGFGGGGSGGFGGGA